MKWSVGPRALLAVVLAATFSVGVGEADDGSRAAGDEPDLSSVSILVLHSQQGAAWPEAELELRNASDRPLVFSGYGDSSPVYRRLCLATDRWTESDPGWCGTGLETQNLKAGQRIRFRATLCDDAAATRIGVAVATREDESWERVWSDAIPSPPRVRSGRMPDFPFDPVAASKLALEYLRTAGAAGNLGTTWKLEAPEVAAVQISDADATACVPAGRYVIVRYEYTHRPAGGPNAIVFNALAPGAETWKRVGVLDAESMDDAIARFREACASTVR